MSSEQNENKKTKTSIKNQEKKFQDEKNSGDWFHNNVMYLTLLNYKHKNDQDSKFYVIYILPQLKKRANSAIKRMK